MQLKLKTLLAVAAIVGAIFPSNAQTLTKGQNTAAAPTPHWELLGEFGIGGRKDCSDIHVNLSGAYFFAPRVYGAVGLGYAATSCTDGVIKYKANVFAMPIEVGYRYSHTYWAVNPYVGVNLGVNVSKSAEILDYKMDADGTFGIEAKVGARICIDKYTLGLGYHIPLNDVKKTYVGQDGYLCGSIGIFF